MPPTTLLAPAPVPLLRRVDALAPFIGRTPLHRLDGLSRPGVDVYAKLEWCQLSGSVKARAAYAMVRAAVRSGAFAGGERRLLEATSGNTGIALAAIGARLGLPVTLCLPANASAKRKALLRALGAEVRLTSPLDGTDGAQEEARALAAAHPERYVYLDQYRNPANRRAHETGTAPEILAQLRPTHFVAGLGTTGTFNGTGAALKARLPGIELVSLEPDAPMHGLEGWKHLATAAVPAIHDPSVADRTETVSTAEALDMLRFLARREGLLVSPSAAANAAGAARLADRLAGAGPSAEGRPAAIVTVFPDDISKYDETLEQL